MGYLTRRHHCGGEQVEPIERTFVLFGSGHVTTLVTILLLSVAVGVLARHWPRDGVARGIAIALVLQEAIKLYYFVAVAELPWQTNLPLHLCRINELLCAVMLVTRSYRIFEVSYFLAMAGSVSAMLTPALALGFPSPEFLLFFVGHGLAVVAVVHAIFAFGFAPRLRSMLITIGAVACYAVVIAPLNYVLDSNYLYLRAQPEPATLLSLFGPWPYYLPPLFALVFIACGIAYAPFAVARALAARSRAGTRV